MGTNNYKFTRSTRTARSPRLRSGQAGQAGQERDPESGLDYFVARYYASNLGRFLQPDFASYSNPHNPQSWNLYGYTLNNPLRFIVPTGHIVTCIKKNDQCLEEIKNAIPNEEARELITLNDDSEVTIAHTETFVELGGENARRLVQLVESSTNILVVYEKIVSAQRRRFLGRVEDFLFGRIRVGEGLSATPSIGYEYQVSIPPGEGPQIDTDANLSGVRPAEPGERMAHGELINGNPARKVINGKYFINKANHIDALDAENNARAAAPNGGRKTYHSGVKIID